jgi:TRAP-type C4-dicarboxylate transport system permease large subunit
VQSARKEGKLAEVMIGAAPYVLVMALMIILLILIPDIALYLPEKLANR